LINFNLISKHSKTSIDSLRESFQVPIKVDTQTPQKTAVSSASSIVLLFIVKSNWAERPVQAVDHDFDPNRQSSRSDFSLFCYFANLLIVRDISLCSQISVCLDDQSVWPDDSFD
jgi:hypothetical protein